MFAGAGGPKIIVTPLCVFSSMLLLAQHEIARSELLHSTVFYFNLLSCGYTDIMHWVNVNL